MKNVSVKYTIQIRHFTMQIDKFTIQNKNVQYKLDI